jgi:hypothetical protein
MTKTTAAVWLWTPRVLGVAMALFLSLFALDAFEGKSILEAIPGFLIHLIPSFLLLAIVALAWRMPLVGAAGFTLLALVYAVMVHWRAGWIAFIGGPLIVIAMLFAGSARHRLPQ